MRSAAFLPQLAVAAALGREITLDSMIGAIVLIGVVRGYASRGFPWCLKLAVPPLIRVFMLRPSQQDLYPIALRLGVYADLLFLVDAAIGVAGTPKARPFQVFQRVLARGKASAEVKRPEACSIRLSYLLMLRVPQMFAATHKRACDWRSESK